MHDAVFIIRLGHRLEAEATVEFVQVLLRADALTTFVQPGHLDGGPSAFEFGMGLGLRIATP